MWIVPNSHLQWWQGILIGYQDKAHTCILQYLTEEMRYAHYQTFTQTCTYKYTKTLHIPSRGHIGISLSKYSVSSLSHSCIPSVLPYNNTISFNTQWSSPTVYVVCTTWYVLISKRTDILILSTHIGKLHCIALYYNTQLPFMYIVLRFVHCKILLLRKIFVTDYRRVYIQIGFFYLAKHARFFPPKHYMCHTVYVG